VTRLRGRKENNTSLLVLPGGNDAWGGTHSLAEEGSTLKREAP